MPSREEIRESLAEYAHVAWSGWMKYMLSKDGVVLPPWANERWRRQMNTPYSELPESEKESDREEASRMLAIADAAITELVEGLKEYGRHQIQCGSYYREVETQTPYPCNCGLDALLAKYGDDAALADSEEGER